MLQVADEAQTNSQDFQMYPCSLLPLNKTGEKIPRNFMNRYIKCLFIAVEFSEPEGNFDLFTHGPDEASIVTNNTPHLHSLRMLQAVCTRLSPLKYINF